MGFYAFFNDNQSNICSMTSKTALLKEAVLNYNLTVSPNLPPEKAFPPPNSRFTPKRSLK